MVRIFFTFSLALPILRAFSSDPPFSAVVSPDGGVSVNGRGVMREDKRSHRSHARTAGGQGKGEQIKRFGAKGALEVEDDGGMVHEDLLPEQEAEGTF